MKTQKVALYNLGCKVNAYEAEAMGELLSAAGYTVVPFGAEADVFIINTCTVTNTADQKSRQIMHRARRLNPNAVIAAAGCYVDTHGEVDPQIDLVIKNSEKNDIVRILNAYFAGQAASEDAALQKELKEVSSTEDSAKDAVSIHAMASHTRAFVKIEDGCDSYCSYCVIPFARGHVVSRDEDDIVREAQDLAAAGYKEIVLTGIQVNAYGSDRLKSLGSDRELLSLLTRLQEIPALSRIRLSSMEPRLMTETFLEGLYALSKFCPHFHLSLQSGCDRTLKAMNRHYTTDEYYAVCERIRHYFPNAALTTDVIVGFPQESEEDFKASMDFVDRVNFYEVHVFPYSRRAGTKADRMEGQIPPQVKDARTGKMIALGKKKRQVFLRGFFGEELEVLFEEKKEIDGASFWVGHSREYIRCAVPDTGEELSGVIRKAEALREENELMICNLS